MNKISPSREGLIVGAALIALHGFEMETIATLRAHKVEDWHEKPALVECRNLAEAIRQGIPIVQQRNPMWSTLAHAQQLLRISLDEWEKVLKITPMAL